MPDLALVDGPAVRVTFICSVCLAGGVLDKGPQGRTVDTNDPVCQDCTKAWLAGELGFEDLVRAYRRNGVNVA